MKALLKSEKKVLTLLERDCRLPANQIAKRLRLSPEGVLKIIRRLENTRIISKFNTKINYSRIGYQLYPVYIKLSNLNDKLIKELRSTLLKHKTCAWHLFCEGEYDLLLCFKIISEREKNDMDKLLQTISDYVLEKELSIVLHAFEISKSFLGQNDTERLFPIFNHELEKVILSDEELKIIDILRSNSRITVLDISKKIDLSARVIASKIKKLEKLNVISGFKIKVNTAILEYQPCMALISFRRYEDKDLRRFMTYCQQKVGINYLVRQMGKYDMALTIDVRNINEFYALIDEIREQFSFIKKITTLIAKESY
ncbi:MAG: Lrp/AsnC family transcriptional regulator [Candidatus Woesearchaeota archaeon]